MGLGSSPAAQRTARSCNTFPVVAFLFEAEALDRTSSNQAVGGDVRYSTSAKNFGSTLSISSQWKICSSYWRARLDGISVAPFERGEIGPDLFQAACRMGLEGLASKHRD